MTDIDDILSALDELLGAGRFEELESDTIEFKPVPADRSQWRAVYETVNAFLNTRGGILVLGVKEENAQHGRKYMLTGWRSEAEPVVKEIPQRFTDRRGVALDLSDRFPPMRIRTVRDGRIALVYVDELAADQRYAFFDGKAFRRKLTGDHRVSDAEIEAQEEYREQATQARELIPISALSLADLDLDRLNEYIARLNTPARIETLKPDLASARPFLERKSFLVNNSVTTLGALVCAKNPGDCLGFRAHLHGYVDVPQEVARDKQDFVDNILPLMEAGYGYLLRNVHVGVSVARGGTSKPQYPDALLRETVNNALAHRDYSIDRQVIIAIKPGQAVTISNPGSFRKHLLVEASDADAVVRRVIPEAKPRNPKLADVLRVYRKWEGRGIGMATLVDICLRNEIDLPFYRLRSNEVTLHLRAGKLLDDGVEQLFASYGRYIEEKIGTSLSEPQRLVLAYLMKSEWVNRDHGFSILLTPDNNHFTELRALERAGLIFQHLSGTNIYPVYLADRILMNEDLHLPELRQVFGAALDGLPSIAKKILGVIYRFDNFAKEPGSSAKQAAFSLWPAQPGDGDAIRAFDTFYRRVRRTFNQLHSGDFIKPASARHRYSINRDFRASRLL